MAALDRYRFSLKETEPPEPAFATPPASFKFAFVDVDDVQKGDLDMFDGPLFEYLSPFLGHADSFSLWATSRCWRTCVIKHLVPHVLWQASTLSSVPQIGTSGIAPFVRRLILDVAVFPFLNKPWNWESMTELVWQVPDFTKVADIPRGLLPEGLRKFRFVNYKGSRPAYPADRGPFAPSTLMSNVFPKSLTQLELMGFDQSLAGVVPDSVRSLTLFHFNQPLTEEDISLLSISRLAFGAFDQPLASNLAKSYLPAYLSYLDLGPKFSHPIKKGFLPSTLTYLKLGQGFHQELRVGDLPPCLTHLDFADSFFNHRLYDGVLPATLTDLTFGPRFNQYLDLGVLPPSLTRLTFGADYDEPLLPVVLPASLRVLHFAGFNQPLEPGVLPPGLEELHMGHRYNQPLPPNALPAGLKRLSFGFDFNQDLHAGQLPAGLKQLKLGDFFKATIGPGALPAGLLKLTFGDFFNRPLAPGVLPSGLRQLTFGHCYNTKIGPGVLPPTLTHLIFGNLFNQPFEAGSLPEGLISLDFGGGFEQPLIGGVLPFSVTRLVFGGHFHQFLPVSKAEARPSPPSTASPRKTPGRRSRSRSARRGRTPRSPEVRDARSPSPFLLSESSIINLPTQPGRPEGTHTQASPLATAAETPFQLLFFPLAGQAASDDKIEDIQFAFSSPVEAPFQSVFSLSEGRAPAELEPNTQLTVPTEIQFTFSPPASAPVAAPEPQTTLPQPDFSAWLASAGVFGPMPGTSDGEIQFTFSLPPEQDESVSQQESFAFGMPLSPEEAEFSFDSRAATDSGFDAELFHLQMLEWGAFDIAPGFDGGANEEAGAQEATEAGDEAEGEGDETAEEGDEAEGEGDETAEEGDEEGEDAGEEAGAASLEAGGGPRTESNAGQMEVA